ncbi:MAG: hypothetical protein R3F34_11745, partial [Planctomycetota bacterium]
ATMSTAQFERYWKVLEAFVVADGRFEPFEWALQEVVRARVFPRHGLATRPKQVVALDDVKQEVRAILSWVARASGDHDGGLGAYRAGVRVLREHGSAAFGSEPPLSAGAAATAVLRRGDHLRGLADVDRRAVLEACEVAAEHDGRLRPQEAELLRALAEAFGLEPRLTAARGPAESPDNPGAER